jgi:signal transduction histidine kinase
MERRIPGPQSSINWGLAGFTPRDQTLFLIENAERFHLRERDESTDFAMLAPPGGGGYFTIAPQPRSERVLARANSRALTSLELAGLRRELAGFGLDWSDGGTEARGARHEVFLPAPTTNGGPMLSATAVEELGVRSEKSAPSTTYVSRLTPHLWPMGAGGWAAFGGVLAALGLGAFLLRYQRTMVRRYVEAGETIRRREAEVEQARQEGLQGQKMQALGLLAGGVSHEFKNLLSTISLSNDLIRRELGPDSEVAEEVDNIDHAVEQGRAVVNSLLGYSRPRDAEEQTCDPVRVIQSTLKLLNREFLGRVTVVFQPPPRALRVSINSARLEQILVNLCTNAVEAMERQGELRVELCDGVVAEQDAFWALRTPTAERLVTLAVADTGCGMERAVLERIFEPFYTTKAGGETPLFTSAAGPVIPRGGSGLGLTTVYRLAEKTGAGLSVWSRVGTGSVFRLVLPRDDSAAGDLGATRPVGEADVQ